MTTTSHAEPIRGADPVPRIWQQLAALAGIAFVVLLIVAFALGGAETPDHSAPVAEWKTYATDHESDLRISALIMGLAAVEFLWFVSYLRSVLGVGEQALRGFTRMSHVAFAGGIAGISGITLGALIGATALYHAEDTPPEIIRTVSETSGAGFQLGMLGFAVMLGGAAFAIRATGALPRWLGIVAAAGSLFGVLTLGTLLSEGYDNAFGMFYPLTFLALIIFIVGASISFFRQIGRA